MSYSDEAPTFPWSDEDLARLTEGATLVWHSSATSSQRLTIAPRKYGAPTLAHAWVVDADGEVGATALAHCDPTTIVRPAPVDPRTAAQYAHLSVGATKELRLQHALAAVPADAGRVTLGQPQRFMHEEPEPPPKAKPVTLAEVMRYRVVRAVAELVATTAHRRDALERAVESLSRDREGTLVLVDAEVLGAALQAAALIATYRNVELAGVVPQMRALVHGER